MRGMILFLVPVLILSFTGCATANKNRETPETVQLSAQVRDLQEELRQKDEEIKMLEDQLHAGLGAREGDIEKPAIKSTPKRIQQALKNAGFYRGAIDGKIGKKTRNAIRAFQRANGLKADGVVGGQTWGKLSGYL